MRATSTSRWTTASTTIRSTPGPNGKLAEQLGVDGQYSPSTEPTITYDGLPAGEHTLTVDLVNNDHTETGTSATVTFTVEK